MRSDLTRLYNQADNPVDVNSQDFKDVLAYLHSHGLPQPNVIVQEVGMPTGPRYTDIELIFLDPLRAPLKMQAFLVMNAPQRAVTDFDLWRGERNPRIPEEYAPKAAAAVVGSQAPVKPTRLVGPLIFGSNYQPVPNDDSADGAKYTDERGTFIKRVTPTPFGNSVHWEKIS